MNEVEIRIGDRDETGPGVRQATNRLQGLRRVAATAGAAMAAGGAAAGGMFAAGLAANMNIEVANDKLAAQLGLTEKEAKAAGEVAGDVYAANWGGSIEEVNAAIKSVGDNLGDVGKMSKDELEGMTTSALALAQTFEVDVAESTKAAGALIKNGLAKDSTEAFDIITYGMQNGLNASGDFLETLNEYSPQFSKLGIDGKSVLNVLSQFMKAGAKDTDVAADAFKEFSLRAIDGSELTVEAYKAIGLNGKEMGKQIAAGGKGAEEGLSQVVKGLQAIKDPQEQNRIGTALFGTQWEDTVRTILPNLDLTKSAIEGVDGSTQAMADTVGDNAAGKIETMRRKFEQWTQGMAETEGNLGLAATAAVQFGGGAMAAGSQIAMMAVAMRGLNLAMLMNPIGLVVLAVAALAAGMVTLWKKSETARLVMTTTFSAVATVVLTNAEIIVKAARFMSEGVLTAIGVMLDGLAKIPGPTQENAQKAAKSFHQFKEGVDGTFKSVERKLAGYKNTVKELPKRIILKGDERDLAAKLRSAQRQLKALPRDKRTRVLTDITRASRAIAAVRARLLGIKDRYVNVFVSEVQRDNAMAGRGKRHGGITGAATGGARGGLTMVGEGGRELVRLPWGSQVIPNGTTENILDRMRRAREPERRSIHSMDIRSAQAREITRAVTRRAVSSGSSSAPSSGGSSSGGARVVIELKSGGSKLDDVLVEVLRKSIRARGGDVQVVLGSRNIANAIRSR